MFIIYIYLLIKSLRLIVTLYRVTMPKDRVRSCVCITHTHTQTHKHTHTSNVLKWIGHKIKCIQSFRFSLIPFPASATLKSNAPFNARVCWCRPFSAISVMRLSTVLAGMSLVLEMIVPLFGNPLNIYIKIRNSSELLGKASFIYPPSANGFPFFAMHCVWFLAAHMVVNTLLCFSYWATAFWIDSTPSASSSKCSLLLMSSIKTTLYTSAISQQRKHKACSFNAWIRSCLSKKGNKWRTVF